jgi:hypothetical protein
MSLLTNEQINDILDITNVCASGNTAHRLYQWNKDQTATPFAEPNWNDAPENAVQAVLNTFWVDEHGATFGVYKEYYNRPKPVITPHPHAEMIMKYAEVAQRRDDPWVEFEVNLDNNWEKMMGNPAWLDYREYRYIGETK